MMSSVDKSWRRVFKAGPSTANAHGDWGIWQIGSGGETVAVNLTNNGTIAVNAAAMANAGEGDASADADLVGGIVQAAFSGTSLAANIDNGNVVVYTIGVDFGL